MANRTMTTNEPRNLSRRERQIMDILYSAGRGTVADVQERMVDAPSYSAVRALLRILEEKGHLRHVQEGPRYIFLPTVPLAKARKSALRQMVSTFFNDSTESAVAALLDLDAAKLTGDELNRLEEMIRQAKQKGRSA